MQCRTYIGVKPETIIFLCEQSEQTAKPWRDAGFSVICVDLAVDGQDVRLIRHRDLMRTLKENGLKPRGLFTMPPCTDLAGSGARWWEAKGEAALLEALSIVDACFRLAEILRPLGLQWFAVENPVGRLSQYLGKPVMTFQPNQYGDPYTKRTCLWGWGFSTDLPESYVEPSEGSKMWKLGPSPERARLRSETPAGFAAAFYEANKGLAA